MKTLVIGDIHGCFNEMVDLIDQAGLTENDRIIALGDLFDRGPDSPAVYLFFKNHPRACSLMGNHERKHLLSYRGLTEPSISQILTRQQFRETYREAIDFMADLPLFLELPEAILIHGMLEPGIPLDKQSEAILVGSLSGEARLKRKSSQPWYKIHDGAKPVIAGHHDYSKEGKPVVVDDSVFLIDTGCCFGKSLSGLLLPDFKLVSVKSRKNYWGEAMQSRKKG